MLSLSCKNIVTFDAFFRFVQADYRYYCTNQDCFDRFFRYYSYENVKERFVVMGKKILTLIVALLAFLVVFTSCKTDSDKLDNSKDEINESELFYSSDYDFRIIYSTEAEKAAAETVAESLVPILGKAATVAVSSAPACAREIVFGRCDRQISKDAYRLLDRKIESGDGDSGYLIYSDSSSIAIAYDSRAEEIVLNEAIGYFVDNYVNSELKTFSGVSYVSVFALLDLLDARDANAASERWKAFADEYGADLAVAMQSLYACYDDNIVDWFANLYDPEIGGFYYSNSARNYFDFLPDVESTKQALGFLVSSGMTKSYNGSSSYAGVISDEMKAEIVGFVRGLQHENGYFYHPQWGRELTDSRLSRRGRDLTWSTEILKELGASPIYDTPNGIKGDGIVSTSGLTSSLRSGAVSSVSKIVMTADYVPEHLLNKKNFEDYLAGLKIKTDSYTVGNELSSQISQIKHRDTQLAGAGYSLVDILITWLNDNQNPETGTWDYLKPGDEGYAVYRGMDGLFKILNIYQAVGEELPYAKEALESVKYCIDVDTEANIVCDVYNTWYTIDMIFDNLNKYSSDREAGRALAAEELEKLRAEAPALVRASTQKILKFMQPDGGFDFDDGSSYTSQGVPVNLPGVVESDVNATVICTSGLVGHIYAALDISSGKTAPIFASADMQRFLDIISDLSPVIKKEVVYKVEYIDFESDEIGKSSDEIKSSNSSSGSIKVVSRGDGKALSINSKKGGGDSVEVNVGQNIINPKCFVFEADICLNSADRQDYLGEISLLDNNGNIIYLLYVESENGKAKLCDVSSVLTDKRIMIELGEFGAIGSWFNLKVEYFLGDHNDFRAKIYLNNNLIAVSDNYYDRNGLKLDGGIGTPRSTYYSTRLSVFSYVEAEILVDNLAAYHTTVPYEIPEDTSSLRNNVDYIDRGEKKYTFDDESVDDIQASANVQISDGALNMSGESEILIPVNIRATKSDCTKLEADFKVSRKAINAQMNLIFAENITTKSPVSGISVLVKTENSKTVVELYDMPGGSVGSLLCKVEPDSDGIVHLKIEYYDGVAGTLIYIDGKLVAMTSNSYDGAKLKRCSGIIVSCNSGIEATLDNLLAEKTVKSYLDAIRPEKDEIVYDFSYSDPQIDTNGQTAGGVLTLNEAQYVKIPVNRRGVASNMVSVEAKIKLSSCSDGSGYRLTLIDKDGQKLIEYVAVKNGSDVYIYESTENTSSLRAVIGKYGFSDTVNLRIDFYFREATANIYANNMCVGVSSTVYNSSNDMTEPVIAEIATIGNAGVVLDNVRFELNYKAFEKEAQTNGDDTDTESLGFESATTGSLPKRLTLNLKSSAASVRVTEICSKQKFTRALRFATGAGANDNITLKGYGGTSEDNCNILSFDACITATAPYDTFVFYVGNSTSEYAYFFELSAAYGNVLLTIGTKDTSAPAQTMRYTIAKEGEWFNLGLEYYYVGDSKGCIKICVNDGFVAELTNISGTRCDNLTYADFGYVTLYSYSDTNAVIYLDNLDLTTEALEYKAGGEIRFETVDFEDLDITGDGSLAECAGFVKVNHAAVLSDGTRATFADITCDPKNAANKVLRLCSTRKSGGSGDGYPTKALSADISVTGGGKVGNCYVYEAKMYISSASYSSSGVVANINLNFGGSEKATSIAINLKTDSEGKKQAYITSVYGADKTTALYTFECDSWITLKLEFYRGTYAADNYGTIIYANGTEVARDLAWRTGLSSYNTREFAAANLFVDRYMAGCILLDDVSVYVADKTHN